MAAKEITKITVHFDDKTQHTYRKPRIILTNDKVIIQDSIKPEYQCKIGINNDN